MNDPLTAASILAVPMGENDSGEETIGGYLAALLELVWQHGEGFDSKRPFGNSGWQYDFNRPLADAGLVAGSRDRYGDLDVDRRAVDALIRKAIGSLRSPAPASPGDLLRAALVEDDLASRAEDEAQAARERAAELRARAAELGG